MVGFERIVRVLAEWLGDAGSGEARGDAAVRNAPRRAGRSAGRGPLRRLVVSTAPTETLARFYNRPADE